MPLVGDRADHAAMPVRRRTCARRRPPPASPAESPTPAVDETPPGDVALLSVSNHEGWIAIGPDGVSPVPAAANGAMPQNIRTHQGRAFGTTYDQIVELRPSGIVPAPGVAKYDVSIVSDFTIAADGSL